MAKKILIVDANTAAAESLKARLQTLGETQAVADVAALTQALTSAWDLIVCDSAVPGVEGAALWRKLQPEKQSVFLYTDRADLVEGDAWREAGLAQAFSRLQRADLVLAAESVLQEEQAGAAPAFLLVEDSATVRQFVKAVLKQAFTGCELVEADDGRAALAAMKSNRISLIITDLQMPGMDGLSFVQLLRNNAVLKKKPVIVLSGAVTDDVRESLAPLEKLRILAKPATPDVLVNAVKNLLS